MYIGIDGAISCTGWCIMNDKLEIFNCNKVDTRYGSISKQSEDDRILYVAASIITIAKDYNIDTLIMEDQFVGKNKKTAMQLCRLRGALMDACLENNIKIDYIRPSELKKIVSTHGNASKDCVGDAVMNIYKNDPFVKALGPVIDKQNKQKNSDIYDSIAIIYSYLIKNGYTLQSS
jgi:crossover junction endodeoxyribonuclease RuvC